MHVRSAVLAVLAVPASVAAWVLAAGCSLDWTVRASPVDASAPRDAAAPVDASADASPVEDADAGAVDATDCAALEANAASAKAGAKQCQLASGECQGKLADECGCGVFVAVDASAASNAYAAAVSALVASGCPLGCAACAVLPVTGTCVQNASGSASCIP